jgi:inosine-uridine nucleoside N-ribohydrolase
MPVPKPTRPYRALRAVVATAVISLILGLWGHGHLTGDPLGAMWDVVAIALLIASGYAIFGRRTMDAAVETAQDVSGQGDQTEASDDDA